ncbi:MAG: universal stress protein [Bacillota bacterium]
MSLAVAAITPVPIHTTPVGVVLGLAFASGVIAILWWMLHPPKAEAIMVKVKEGAERLAEAGGRILVGTRGGQLSQRLLNLACDLAKSQNVRLTAIYVVELPMTLPLDAPVPEEMRLAEQVLAEAEEVAKQHNVGLDKQVARARKAGRAIVDEAKAAPTRLIVLGLGERPNFEDRFFGSTADFVVRHAPCDVILERPSFVAVPSSR